MSFEEAKKEAFIAFLENDDLDLDFDLYSQDITKWEWLTEYVPGVVVNSAGGMCPFQAEGLIKGYPFYYRERHGVATLKINDMDAEDAYGSNVLWSASVDVDEFAAQDTFFFNFIYLVDNLEKHPYLYYFAGRKFNNDLTDVGEMGSEKYAGWGFTPEEAFESTRKISSYLTEHGISEQKQKDLWEARDMQPEPINLSELQRNYPDVDPGFEVKVPENYRDDEGKLKHPKEMHKIAQAR